MSLSFPVSSTSDGADAIMSDYARHFLAESQNRFALAWGRVEHCLDQLDNEHMWWTPEPGHNAIGTLMLHLCGNLEQWIIAGVGGAADTRVRREEFVPQPHMMKDELHARLSAVMNRIQEILDSLPAESLLAKRRIQGNEVTGMAAIYKAVTHMEIHAGQMLLLTRMMKGDQYRESWAPRTPEEGA